ncbi:hypothetical protein CRG98_000726 [Punica granatum]|uniref:G-patch domain-containing protein n=1 Tax=Punica granatum TaxID=22663 RepID=A0A2I0LDW2_PUNGR|nr:hypothetical protein CRG98_000726 [Punica granatum]
MGITHSGQVYQGLEPVDKGKAPATEFSTVPKAVSFPTKKVTDQEAETFMKMNVDMSHIRASKTTVRAFDGSKRIVNGEIDLLIDVGKLITVNGEEDYVVYKEIAVPYISIGEDQNLPFHSFDTISVIRDYGEVDPSRTDRMIGKVLLKNNYVPGTGLGAHAQGILRPVEVEEYRNRRGLGFRPSYHEILQARRGKHLHRLATHYGKLFRGIPVPPLSQFFFRTTADHGRHLRHPNH